MYQCVSINIQLNKIKIVLFINSEMLLLLVVANALLEIRTLLNMNRWYAD